jgi:NTE family protein
MKWTWPWWIVKPKLGVVLSGGATIGAFQVGVIDVMARRGIVPDLLVGTSVGAINAAFWALNPEPNVGERLVRLWLECDRSTMFPDSPVPMVGRLLQRRDHVTTQRGLERVLQRSLPEGAKVESCSVALALIATEAKDGQRVVLRNGQLLPAMLASSAIPGLWPAVEIDGHCFFDGGLVASSDVQTAVEAGMSDIIIIDVMSGRIENGTMDVAQILEWSARISARRQTELAIRAFGHGLRIAVLRPNLASGPWLGDFSRTRQLFHAGQMAAEVFLARHLGQRRSVRPGVFEVSSGARAQATDALASVASA